VSGQPSGVTLDQATSAFGQVLRLDASHAAAPAAAELATAPSATQLAHDLVHAAQGTTSVATMSYEFFTGSAPTSAGMDYLVSPTGGNANNLNSAHYQDFNLENRYINFAVGLGKAGAGAASFQASYGDLDLFGATKQAYATIFGGTPSDAKVHALLDTVVDGHAETRADYFALYGGDGAAGIGTKAAMVGWLLAEAVKADVGAYAQSNDAFLTDVALHNAPFGVDIVGHYDQPGWVFAG
jgi:serralysin